MTPPLTRALLRRHAGIWHGTYRHVTPEWELVDTYKFAIRAEILDGDAPAYRQTSQYSWDDGRTDDRVFEAEFNAVRDRLVWDDGRISGEMWALDQETLYLRFAFAEKTGAHVCEMLQLSPCNTHRARTWHWFEDHKLTQITFVREARADTMLRPEKALDT